MKRICTLPFTFFLLSISSIGSCLALSSNTVALSQASSDSSFLLLAAGSRWAASNGNHCLYVSWYDNLQAHPNQYLPDPDLWLPSRTAVSSNLEVAGLNVSFAADIPANLTGLDVLVIEAYFACEPSKAQLIEDYISNGGGIVLLFATPRYLSVYCKDMWPGSDLEPIQEWFGASYYVNSGGKAYVAVDNPLGTNLLQNQILFTNPSSSLSAVETLHQDSQVLANWQSGTCFAFTHTYGQGRIYYQANYRLPGPLRADFTWYPHIVNIGEPVTFDASSSQPGWNNTDWTSIVEYKWNFGDGNMTSTANAIVTHTYASPGLPTTTLTVYDNAGSNSSVAKTISVISSMHISISTDTASSFVGLLVNIQGALEDDYGNGLKDEIVLVSYTFAGADVWFPISSATTNDMGRYSLQWIPTASGNFSVMAEWRGNQTYLGTHSLVSLSILPYLSQYVFSVESNSTISALAFNSTSYELVFTASGEPGTRGYAKVTIAKSLIQNAENIRVYLDGNLLNYTLTSTEDSWILNFDYSHSIHKLTVNLIEAVPEFTMPWFLMIVVTTTILLALIKLKRSNRRGANVITQARFFETMV